MVRLISIKYGENEINKSIKHVFEGLAHCVFSEKSLIFKQYFILRFLYTLSACESFNQGEGSFGHKVE